MALTDIEEEGEGKKKSGLIVTIAIVAVLSAIAGGGGWVVGGLIAPQVKQPDVALEPITTNLSYPSDNWIRVEVSLVFDDQPDNELADRIHQDILAYLRTVSLQQIEGPRGFQYLREDLRERVKLRSEGRVNELLLRTFVIE